MKIQSGHPEPVVVQQTKAVKPQAAQSEPPKAAAQTQDNFHPTQSKKMLELLHSLPDVRPEALEKAKQLAADPTYPPADMVENIAKLFINDGNRS